MFRDRVIQLTCPPIQVIRSPSTDANAPGWAQACTSDDPKASIAMAETTRSRRYRLAVYWAYSCPSDPSATVMRRSPRVAGPISSAPVVPLNSEPWHGHTNRARLWS